MVAATTTQALIAVLMVGDDSPPSSSPREGSGVVLRTPTPAHLTWRCPLRTAKETYMREHGATKNGVCKAHAQMTRLFAFLLFGCVESFVSVDATRRTRPSLSLYQQVISTTALELDRLYAESFELIDECASSGQPTDQLYDAVRYIDKNAIRLYPNEDAKVQLWERAHESTSFKPVPIFAFAMIDDKCFGNGVGMNNGETIILSLLGPHYFNAKRRQMGIGIEDVFLFSKNITQYIPRFVGDGMLLGKRPEDFEKMGKSRMPAFNMIGASDKSLIARGGSGGIAIWTRLKKDMIWYKRLKIIEAQVW